MDFSTHSIVMDKPSWGPTNREVIQKKRRYIEFVTTSVTFYLIFPKFSTKINIFDDLDKVTMNILNLMCSHGPGR